MKTANVFALVALLAVQGVSAQLNILAKLSGKQYFGSAVDNYELAEERYAKGLGDTREFGQITPSNTMKWETLEPVRGTFNFTGGEEIIAFAKKHRQFVRGHACVWHSQLAPWVEAGNFTAAELNQIIWDHTYTMVKHYKGDILHWDVVNEAFEEDGSFRQTVFYKALGPKYIDTAFKAARAADPKAKLYINDYNFETISPKTDAVVALVKDLKKRKIPIDGIGAQGHLILGELPTDIKENFQRFAALGVDVAITELDIRMQLPVTPEKLEQQKKDYEVVIKACKAVKRCVGVTIWDYTDKYSWVPGWFDGEGAPLPWDEEYNKKPAYYGIVDGWLGRRK